MCPECGSGESVDFGLTEFEDGALEWVEHCLICEHEWRVFMSAEEVRAMVDMALDGLEDVFDDLPF